MAFILFPIAWMFIAQYLLGISGERAAAQGMGVFFGMALVHALNSRLRQLADSLFEWWYRK